MHPIHRLLTYIFYILWRSYKLNNNQIYFIFHRQKKWFYLFFFIFWYAPILLDVMLQALIIFYFFAWSKNSCEQNLLPFLIAQLISKKNFKAISISNLSFVSIKILVFFNTYYFFNFEFYLILFLTSNINHQILFSFMFFNIYENKDLTFLLTYG